jgi:hypothetical protein
VSADGQGEAYVQVANYGAAATKIRLTVSRGTTRVSDQPVDLAAGEAVSQVVPLPAGGGARLLARIEGASDAMAEDDEAVAWLEGAEAVEVALVSDDPIAILRILRQDRSLNVTPMRPANYVAPSSGIVVFDRWAPAAAPTRPALLIAPPTTSWLGEAGADEREPLLAAAASHPAVAGVDPLTLELERARKYTLKGLAPLVQTESGSVAIAAGSPGGRRMVLWSFSATDANPFSPGLPILVGSSVDWLARPSYGVFKRPGPLRLPADTTRVVAPDGRPVMLTHTGDSTIARLSAPGLYLVDAGGARGVIGVNVGDAETSNLARANLAPEAVLTVAAGGAGWPWWLWAVVVAFVLTTIEWWTWQRRVTV